jgi:hypothetical protein
MTKLFLISILFSTQVFAEIFFPGGFATAWKAPVANSAALPSSGNNAGDCRVAKDTLTIYCWSGSTWSATTGGGGGGGIAGSWSSTTGNIVTTNGASTAQDSGTALTALCSLTGTQTLTNKTLTSPVIGAIVNTGTLTLPTSTDTLVGRATTDTLTNKTLSSSAVTGTLKAGNYHIEPSENNAGNSSTAQTIDWSAGSAQLSTLTGNVTYTFSNPVAGGAYVLRIATGAGSFTTTWPASVKWSGGTAPTITATASKVDLINFYYDGTYYYGSFAQNF